MPSGSLKFMIAPGRAVGDLRVRDAGRIQRRRPLIHAFPRGNAEREVIEAGVVRVEAIGARRHELHKSDDAARSAHDTGQSGGTVLPEELFEAEEVVIPASAGLAIAHGDRDMAESGEIRHPAIMTGATRRSPR